MAKTEKSCVVCTKKFTGNANKTTCSAACRTKLSRMKSKGEQPEEKPKVQVQNLTEPTHVVKPITAPKKKDNIAINTTGTGNNNPSLRSILTGLGYQPTGERKAYVPKVK